MTPRAVPSDPPDAMRLLGQLARRLLVPDPWSALERAADLLRRASGADDCEIFLSEPEGGDLLLAACRGRDRDALLERTRFGPGAGFPGIAAATGRPVMSRQLDRDRRFLRRDAVRRGLRAFVATPLAWGEAPVGCVSLAWHGGTPPVERGAELLQTAAALLATAIRSGLLTAREQLERELATAGPKREDRCRACLRAMVAASGARGGTLALYDREDRETAVYSTASAVDICASALDGRLRCRVVAGGHGMLLSGGRGEWPSECRCLPDTTHAPVCLPLRLQGRLRGVVVLDRGNAAGGPPGRELVPLLAMAREAALRLAGGSEPSPPEPAGAAGAVLEIRTLGGFELRLHGRPVPPEAFVRRKALALLKLLLLNAGNPVSRHALAEHLWPGVGEKAGANRLHGVLHALRSAIEPFREQRRWIYVCNIGEFYYFNMESPHWIDLYAFRRQAAAGHEAARRDRIQEAIRHLEAALALYRGDLFADEPYAGWCELDRSELRHRSVDLMGQVAGLWVQAGDPSRGVAWLRRGLQADPLREDLHQDLIRMLVRLGRRREAHAQYEACVRLLREELGADPLPETRRLRSLLARPHPDDPSAPARSPTL